MSDVERLLTQAVREADKEFERCGGSSRHWVRECFLPALDAHGLLVVEAASGFDRGVALIELALSQLRRDNADSALQISKAMVEQTKPADKETP
jgi:hypothetical protein